MNREELAATVGEMKETATMFVQRYAAIHAPDVSAAMVESICRALGDISIDEATAALDRLQEEQRRAVLRQDAKEGRIIECPPR